MQLQEGAVFRNTGGRVVNMLKVVSEDSARFGLAWARR